MQYKAFEQYAGTNPKSVNPAFLNLIRADRPQPVAGAALRR